MIELVPTDRDDREFLRLAQRILNGAVAALGVRDVYLVYIDNWFDHKWLGFWSTWKENEPKELCVPPFNPNRVRSEKHFVRDTSRALWIPTHQGKPLHLRQPGRCANYKQRIDRLAKSAIFVWYSGNTETNGAGSLMLYLSGAEGYAWYASFRKAESWKVADEFRITRRELLSFEEGGRQREPIRT